MGRLGFDADQRQRLEALAGALVGDATGDGEGTRPTDGERVEAAPLGPRYAQDDDVELGRGGLGRVMLQHDEWLRRDVALKELLPGVEGRQAEARLQREARITAQLEHPSILPVYELAMRADGRPYYTMQVVRGRTLRDAVEGGDSERGRLRWVGKVIDAGHAIAYAHDRGVVHRDLTPTNLMVGAFGETYVVDWGLARRVEEPGGSGSPFGTPAYASPEHLDGGDVGVAADVWGLGAVLHFVLTGQAPFAGERRASDAAPTVRQRADVPGDLAAIADKALCRDPAQRYPTAAAFVSELEAWRDGRRVASYPYTAWELLRGFATRKPGLTAAIGAAALFLVVGSVTVGLQARQVARARDLAEAGQARALQASLEAEDALATLLLERAARAGSERDWSGAAVYAAAALVHDPDNGASSRPDDEGAGSLEQSEHLARAESWFDLATARRGYVHARDLALPQVDGLRSVRAVAFSPDGTRLVGSLAAGGLAVWDLATGAVVGRSEGPALERGWGGVWWGAQGIADRGDSHAVRRWTHALEPIPGLTLKQSQTAAAVPEDGSWAIVGDREGTVAFFEPDGRQRWTTSISNRPVEGLGLSPDETRVYVVGLEPHVTALDAVNGRILWTRELSAFASRVAASPDGATLALAASDDAIRLLSSDDGALRHRWPTGFRPRSVVFARDGRLAHPTGSTLAAIRTSGGDLNELLHAPHRGSEWLAWSGDGALLAGAGEHDSVRVWERSPPGREVLASTARVVGPFDVVGARFVVGSQDPTVQVYELTDRIRPAGPPVTPDGLGGPPFFVALSPDGLTLATTDRYGSTELHRVDDGARLHRFPRPPSRRFAVRPPRFSADGRWLVVGRARDLTLHPLEGQERVELEVPGEAWATAWGPDGSLYVGTVDGSVHRFERGDWGLETLPIELAASVTDLAWSPDGRWLAAADHGGGVWLRGEGGSPRLLQGHDDSITDLCFSSDGRWLVSTSADRTARIWRTDDGTIRRIYEAADNVDGCWVEPNDEAIWFDDGTDVVRLEVGQPVEDRDPAAMLAEAEAAAGVWLDGSELRAR